MFEEIIIPNWIQWFRQYLKNKYFYKKNFYHYNICIHFIYKPLVSRELEKNKFYLPLKDVTISPLQLESGG